MLNVVSALRQALIDALDVPVYVNIPDERPSVFVVINRGGGAWENTLIDRAGINVYAYAETEGAAYELMEHTCEAIRTLPFSDGFCRMEMENIRSDYDLKAKAPRWYSSWTITNYQPLTKE